MKKLFVFGFVLTLISAAASAQQASGEGFRRHRTEESYGYDNYHRGDRRFEEDRYGDHFDRGLSRRERHRLYRMHRYERWHFHHFRHRRNHRLYDF